MGEPSRLSPVSKPAFKISSDLFGVLDEDRNVSWLPENETVGQ